MKMKKLLLILIAPLSFSFATFAQETSTTDTLAKTLESIKSDLEQLKKIKLSGYLQPQFQATDSSGAPSYAGGAFPSNTDKRFMMRRARIKLVYEGNWSQYVFQIDAVEGNGFSVKDIYAKFTEPWLKTFSLTMGIMNRPFGYEIGMSSSLRESPERGRMSQIIFPNERDMGAMLTIQAPKTSPLNIIKLEAGMFNGSSSAAKEFDYYKDFIGHLTVSKALASEKVKITVGGSYYNGGLGNFKSTNGKVYVYSMGSLANGLKGFVPDSTSNNGTASVSKREYFGFDAQISIDNPIGLTILRGEFITGNQPGIVGSTAAYPNPSGITSPVAPLAANTYTRNFNGAYFYLVQNVWTTKWQVILKYDWFDPNTKVEGTDIGAKDANTSTGTNLTTSDIKFTTVGLGLAYRWDNNVKITGYYDLVTNENTKLVGYTQDLKDNVFTFRVQYKF